MSQHKMRYAPKLLERKPKLMENILRGISLLFGIWKTLFVQNMSIEVNISRNHVIIHIEHKYWWHINMLLWEKKIFALRVCILEMFWIGIVDDVDMCSLYYICYLLVGDNKSYPKMLGDCLYPRLFLMVKYKTRFVLWLLHHCLEVDGDRGAPLWEYDTENHTENSNHTEKK